MKVMGFSVTTILVLVACVWIGTKFPNLFARVPLLR